MKNIAIICEYNPFHRGHLEQFNIIRSTFGQECRIICIMSGSIVQRGESAVYCKYDRARAAVLCGASLVLEMPYPYSGSCAEIFARAGVLACASLGKIDCLVFGSECGDTNMLRTVANRLESEEFIKTLDDISKKEPGLSFPRKRSEAYRLLYGEELSEAPNDTLGIEYIKAARHAGVEVFTYKRQPGYSATRARAACLSGEDMSMHLPHEAYNLFSSAQPMNMSKYFGRTLLSFCHNAELEYLQGVFDMPMDLASRIKKHAMSCASFNELVDRLCCPSYTRARIKREILYGYTRTLKLNSPCPAYLQLLAADLDGVAYLKEIKNITSIPVITKVSEVKKQSIAVRVAYLENLKADEIFCLSGEREMSPDYLIKKTPYIENRKHFKIVAKKY